MLLFAVPILVRRRLARAALDRGHAARRDASATRHQHRGRLGVRGPWLLWLERLVLASCGSALVLVGLGAR